MKVEKTPKGMLTFGAVVDTSGVLKNFMLKVKDTDVPGVHGAMQAAIAALP